MIHKIFVVLCISTVYIFGTDGEYRNEGRLMPKAGQLSHQVSIRIDDKHFCGGTILDKYTILTSAECLKGRLFNKFTIAAGIQNSASKGDTYKSTFTITHSEYDERTGNNNLAIIKVTTPIKFNENVAAAHLPKTFTVYGRDVVVAGWGWKPTPNSSSIDELLQLNLKTLPLEKCNATLHDRYNLVTNKHICVNPCEDGGIWTGNATNVLLDGDYVAGVATWFSTLDCNVTTPDLYTSIHMYKDWIIQHLSPV